MNLACPLPCLPVLVFRTVERRAVAFGIDIEDVLPAPGLAVRFVLVAPHAPLVTAGYRVRRHLPQEPYLGRELLYRLSGHRDGRVYLHPCHQYLKRLGV